MKKILLCLISVIIACSLLTSCGKKKENDEEQMQMSESVVKTLSIKEWLDKESENIEKLKESMEGTDLELELVSREKSLVYQYRFTKVSKDDVDVELKEQLEFDMEEQKDSMKKVLEMLKKEVADIESVIYEYYDNENNLITSCEIK